MSKLTKADVDHVAKLANLNLSDSEIEVFLPQLSSIVEFVGQLNEVDTANVEPTTQTTGLKDVYRDDVVDASNCLPAEAALSGTDNTHNNYFKVKAILEERSDK